MRRSAVDKEKMEAGAGVDPLTMDSLLLPWDPPAPHRPVPRQERGVADVLECGINDLAEDIAGPVVDTWERPRPRTAPHRRADLAHASGPQGSESGPPEQRHHPSGRALAWQEPPQPAPAGSGHNRTSRGKEALAASHGLVSGCLENATKPRPDLDVHGTASRKAILSPDPFTRLRGAGKPPPNSGAAPQGQPFLDRGPASPPRYGKGPALQAKPRGSPIARPRSTSGTGRGRAGSMAAPASNRSYTTYSENWYAKRDNSFGHDLRAFHEAARHSSLAAGDKPLLPATKYAGLKLPVSNSRVVAKEAASRGSKPQGIAAAGSAAVGSTTKAAPREQPHGACKRKALQHGRPQLASASKAPASAAVDLPPPELDAAISRGRVTAVPGLSLYQPAAFPQRTSAAALVEPREEGVKIGDKNIWRAAPAHFAGAGGGRASDSVLALTSPNLVGGASQVAVSLSSLSLSLSLPPFLSLSLPGLNMVLVLVFVFCAREAGGGAGEGGRDEAAGRESGWAWAGNSC
jgi:hypothetical protein